MFYRTLKLFLKTPVLSKVAISRKKALKYIATIFEDEFEVVHFSF